MSNCPPHEQTPGPAHEPVMLAEMLAVLAPADGEVHVDATFGRGGYSAALLDAAHCRVEAVDRDPAAVDAGRILAARYLDRFVLRHGRFSRLDALVAGPVDGIAFDLGVSSPQLDDPVRGFSFRTDGPLDMRMDQDGPNAADAVNRLPEAELAQIVREFGEERHARRVARAIVAARSDEPIRRTLQLAEIVRRVVPRAADGIDPATRTFQALRLYVNNELIELDHGLAAAERLLRPGARLAVVSFHSLEDRRVKQFLAGRSGAGPGVSRHVPVRPTGRPAPTFRLVHRKALTPRPAETIANPRARSARLRAAVRTAAPLWEAA